MNEIHLPKTKVAELHAICAERNNDPGELINILHAAQGLFGYLPPEVQQVIAAELNIPVSRVYGVVTFYSFFTMTPKGKYPISVCWERPVTCVAQKMFWKKCNVNWK